MLTMRVQKGTSRFVAHLPEWILSLTLGAFAAQLLLQQDSFDSMPAFDLLGDFVPQLFWAAYSGVISVAWIVGLTINGVVPTTRRWTPWVRGISALFASSFWAINTFLFFIAGPQYPGFIPNGGFAALALSMSFIIAREIGIKEGRNGRSSGR